MGNKISDAQVSALIDKLKKPDWKIRRNKLDKLKIQLDLKKIRNKNSKNLKKKRRMNCMEVLRNFLKMTILDFQLKENQV